MTKDEIREGILAGKIFVNFQKINTIDAPEIAFILELESEGICSVSIEVKPEYTYYEAKKVMA